MQLKGVPQGLSLSYILSSFYYASIENNLKLLTPQKSTASDFHPRTLKQNSNLKFNAANFLLNKKEENLEENLNVKNGNLDLVMRLTDDYLIISDKKDYISKVIRNLADLSESGIIKLNKNKIKTNFEFNLPNFNFSESHLIKDG